MNPQQPVDLGRRAQAALLRYCAISVQAFRLFELRTLAREAWYTIAALATVERSGEAVPVGAVYQVARRLGINRGSVQSERYAFQRCLEFLRDERRYVTIIDARGNTIETGEEVGFKHKILRQELFWETIKPHTMLWLQITHDPETIALLNRIKDQDSPNFDKVLNDQSILLFGYIGDTYSTLWLKLLDALSRHNLNRQKIQTDTMLWIIIHTLIYISDPADFIMIGNTLLDFGIRSDRERLNIALDSLASWEHPSRSGYYEIPRVLNSACKTYLKNLASAHEEAIQTSREAIEAAVPT